VVSNHFVDESLLFIELTDGYVNGALEFIDTFFTINVVVVRNHKSNFMFIGLKYKPSWLTHAWKHMRDGDIVRYLSAPLGVNFSLNAKCD
jgi:hypothetical protein